jgi:hypothetical protein
MGASQAPYYYLIIGLQQKGLIDFLQSAKPRNCKTIKKKKNKWQF